MEPRHHLEWLLCVHLEIKSRTIEFLVTHADSIDVASITISWGNETVAILTAALIVLHADVKTWVQSCGNLVCLPQTHLCAACSHVALTTVVVRTSYVG